MSFYFKPGEVNIICTDLERSVEFYCRILGFEEVGRVGGAARIRLGARQYLLLPFAAQAKKPDPYMTVPAISFGLATHDLAAASQYLNINDVTIITDYQEGGDPFIEIQDPDGLTIEIVLAD